MCASSGLENVDSNRFSAAPLTVTNWAKSRLLSMLTMTSASLDPVAKHADRGFDEPVASVGAATQLGAGPQPRGGALAAWATAIAPCTPAAGRHRWASLRTAATAHTRAGSDAAQSVWRARRRWMVGRGLLTFAEGAEDICLTKSYTSRADSRAAGATASSAGRSGHDASVDPAAMRRAQSKTEHPIIRGGYAAVGMRGSRSGGGER
jgi:hypothetical protein